MRVPRLRLARRVALLCLVLLAGSLGTTAAAAGQAGGSGGPEATTEPIPTLAYYYIWFDPTSWNRAKTDYLLAGRYSSSEQRVMRKHIQWAKQAGIDGWIVSWKSTPISTSASRS